MIQGLVQRFIFQALGDSAALVASVVATVAVTAGLLKVLAKKAPTDA